RRVFPYGVEQHGSLELRRNLAHHVDALGFQMSDVTQRVLRQLRDHSSSAPIRLALVHGAHTGGRRQQYACPATEYAKDRRTAVDGSIVANFLTLPIKIRTMIPKLARN